MKEEKMNSRVLESNMLRASALAIFLALTACGSGGGGADTVTAGQTVAADTTAPLTVANPGGGTFSANQSVVLSTNEASTVYYTTDGSTPSVASSVYTAPIFLSSTTTLKFYARDTAGNSSGVLTEQYTLAPDNTVPTANAAPSGGAYDSVQFVTLSSSEPATIYYTTNGAAPNTGSSVYVSPLTIASTTTLKFFARDVAGNSSGVSTLNYTIDSSVPSVVANPAGGSFKGTQFVTLVSNKSGTIYYSFVSSLLQPHQDQSE
jgi:Chitobiase/beta-hexosaminidase C-terminal domain